MQNFKEAKHGVSQKKDYAYKGMNQLVLRETFAYGVNSPTIFSKKGGNLMGDLREKILAGENALEKLMRKIPGFEGYKNREQARNADKIQRTFMAKELTRQKGRLSDIGQEMVSEGNIMLMADLDKAIKLFDKVIDRIEHAEYGYSSLFSSTKIDVEQLDDLYEYDLTMLDEISRIEEAVTALEGSMDMEGADLKKKIKDIQKSLKMLNDKIDGRQKLLKGVE